MNAVPLIQSNVIDSNSYFTAKTLNTMNIACNEIKDAIK
jgi:hypothetical protein